MCYEPFMKPSRLVKAWATQAIMIKKVTITIVKVTNMDINLLRKNSAPLIMSEKRMLAGVLISEQL